MIRNYKKKYVKESEDWSFKERKNDMMFNNSIGKWKYVKITSLPKRVDVWAKMINKDYKPTW